MKKTLLLLLAGYSVLVVLVSVIPISSGTSQSLNEIHVAAFRLDHLLHTAVFVIWGIFAGFYIMSLSGNRKKLVILLFFAGLLLAILSEYIQKYIPYRGYNINDMIGNVLGVVFSFGFWIILKGKRFLTNTT